MRIAPSNICTHKAARRFTFELANSGLRPHRLWYNTGEVLASQTTAQASLAH